MLRTRAFIQHGKGLDDPREVKLAHNPQVLTFTLVLTLLPKPRCDTPAPPTTHKKVRMVCLISHTRSCSQMPQVCGKERGWLQGTSSGAVLGGAWMGRGAAAGDQGAAPVDGLQNTLRWTKVFVEIKPS